MIALYYGVNTSESKIREFLENVGIHISAGEISNLLIKKEEAYAFLEQVRLAKKVIRQLSKLPQEKMLSAEEIEHLLEEHLPDIGPQ